MRLTRTLLALGLLIAAFTSVSSVSLSSRLRAKQANTTIEQCPANSTNNTNVNVDEQINSYGQQFDNDTDDLRDRINDALDDNNNWRTADENFNNVVTYLQAILRYADDDLYSVKIDIDDDYANPNLNDDDDNDDDDDDRDDNDDDDDDNDDDDDDDDDVNNGGNANYSSCAFLQDGDLPANNTQCSAAYQNLVPHFINFANAANSQNVKYALYWLLQALPSLPELASNCYNADFNLPQEDFDQDECEDEIEDLVDIIGDLRSGNVNTLNRASRVRRIITSRVPQVVAYCLGTEN